MDDILVTRTGSSLITQVKTFLNTIFLIKDLDPLRYFHGLEVARSAKGIYLNQRKYTLDILQDIGLTDARPSNVPIEQHHSLLITTGDTLYLQLKLVHTKD